jgi:hypothetical protein
MTFLPLFAQHAALGASGPAVRSCPNSCPGRALQFSIHFPKDAQDTQCNLSYPQIFKSNGSAGEAGRREAAAP